MRARVPKEHSRIENHPWPAHWPALRPCVVADLDRALRLESETAARELLHRVRALDRRLDVELLTDVRLLADQLARSARQFRAGSFHRLPEVDRPLALGHLVRNPCLEAQAGNLLELIDRFVPQVAPQLLDRGLRVSEVPED